MSVIEATRGLSTRITRLERAWLAIAAVTAVRVAALLAMPIELHGDEAQYWSWSRALDWGYFSKPPLVAWAAWLSTTLFGDAEWAIRLGSPLAHGVAAVCLVGAARRRWGEHAAMWTGLLYVTMPAVWLSSGIISTDPYLLALWAGALWAIDRVIDRPAVSRGLVLGVFVGLGFLAKYAMIYFVIGAICLAAIHRPARRALASRAGLAAAVTAALILAPNLIWNASHHFATISHTAANANWGGGLFHLDELGDFLLGQAAVFGPIPLVLLVMALAGLARATREARERFLSLLCFTLPALAIVSAEAFLSRANANWAAVSYCAGSILVAVWALEHGRRAWLVAALGMHLAVGAFFFAVALSPQLANRIEPIANGLKRSRGWAETTELVRKAYEEGDRGEPYAAVLVDNRLVFHDLEYYGRADPLPLRMWWRQDHPHSTAEQVAPMTALDGPVLVVSEVTNKRREDEKVRADFDAAEPAREVVIPLGGGRERRLHLFAARGFDPLPRGPEYDARWQATPPEE